MPWLYDMECGPRCHSKQHALELNAAITKTTLEGVQAYSALCHQGALLADMHGRTALHMAASVGKSAVVEWLLTQKGLDINARDSESGWTPLHRALFYGRLNCARLLMQHNADLNIRDHEGLCPLDLITMDRPKPKPQTTKLSRQKKQSTDSSDVYSWGDNTNFNLGHGKEHRRPVPEVVDTFSRGKIIITQVALCKYHSVFLQSTGWVYSCGHGQGGRLGHGDEATCLTPRWIESLKKQTCVKIAAARDHTVFLMDRGAVYACGMNDHHQLGPMPRTEKALRPMEINTKSVKNRLIIGVGAGRYHTVLFTNEAVYTFGLNAGQLGHSKGAAYQSQVRQVSALNHEDVRIAQVSCSTAATAVLTTAGNLYVLHQYGCRKVASKLVDMKKVLVTGGRLDHEGDADLAQEKDRNELTLLLLHQTGHVMVWRETNPGLKGCRWAIRRLLRASDIALSSSCLAFTTPQGEAFLAYLPSSKKKQQQQQQSSSSQKAGGWAGGEFTSSRLSDQALLTEVEDVQVRRVPNVYRATSIATDARGVNFAVLQTNPSACVTVTPTVSETDIRSDYNTLLEEADEFDNIHDVIIEAGDRRFAAHRYVLAMRSDYFRKQLQGAGEGEEGQPCVLTIPDVHPQLMEQVLKYIYTDTCDLLTLGAKWSFHYNGISSEQAVISASYVLPDDVGMEREEAAKNGELSEYDADQLEMEQFRLQTVLKDKDWKKSARKAAAKGNFMELLQEAARLLGVKELARRLDETTYVKGMVVAVEKFPPLLKLGLDRSKFPEFYDVCIQSSDGQQVQCHKCVLVARLEYFRCMLGSGWIETSNSSALSLAIPGDILTLLLDFIYTDQADCLHDCTDTELLCNVLIVADQLLVTRLKEICEQALAKLLCLKNAAELLEFAYIYNAMQLRATCLQFICLNLAAVLEGRLLEVLSDDTLDGLTAYYRCKILTMSWRFITPSLEGPSTEFLEQLAKDFAAHEGPLPLPPTQQQQQRKGKGRRKRSHGKGDEAGQQRQMATSPRAASESVPRQRQASVCSELSVASEEDGVESQERGLEEEEEEQQQEAKDSVPSTPSPRPASAAVPIPPRSKNSPWGARELGLRLGVSSPPTQRDSLWGVGPQSPPTPSTPGPPPPTPPPTPATPTTPESSLREMLRQDDVEKAKSKSGKSRFSWREEKKKQQQKEAAASTSAPPPPAPSRPVCPWAVPSQAESTKMVQSFRDLQEEQSRVKLPPPTPIPTSTPSVEKVASPTTPTDAVPLLSWVRPRKTSESRGEVPPSPLGPPPNPWQASLATSPPSPSAAACFTDIVRDEMQKTENLDRSARKPLALIQIEERAIQELLQLYRAGEREDERVTVERVPQATAAPVWRRHSQPPASRTLKPVSSSHSLHPGGM